MLFSSNTLMTPSSSCHKISVCGKFMAIKCGSNPYMEEHMPAKLIALFGSCFLVFFASSLRAQDDPRTVIEKGIKAVGGEARINKYKAGQIKSKDTVIFQGI